MCGARGGVCATNRVGGVVLRRRLHVVVGESAIRAMSGGGGGIEEGERMMSADFLVLRLAADGAPQRAVAAAVVRRRVEGAMRVGGGERRAARSLLQTTLRRVQRARRVRWRVTAVDCVFWQRSKNRIALSRLSNALITECEPYERALRRVGRDHRLRVIKRRRRAAAFEHHRRRANVARCRAAIRAAVAVADGRHRSRRRALVVPTRGRRFDAAAAAVCRYDRIGGRRARLGCVGGRDAAFLLLSPEDDYFK